MTSVARRLVVSAALLVLVSPVPAAADWLLTPYIGAVFARETTFLVFSPLASGEGAAGRKLTIGGSMVLLTDAGLGIEADISHTPGFFNEDPLFLVVTSRVTTMTGSVIAAMPRAITRESLRPYVVAGLGLMQARGKHQGDVFPVDLNLLGLNLGAGAIGMVSDRTGLRFEIRHLKAVTGADGPFARPGVSRLSFWRAAVGVAFRVD